jgi:hypothetical protein
MGLSKVKKTGSQVSGGSTNLGKLGRAGTTAKVGTGASKSSLGYTAMVNRNTAKMGKNLARGAY